jgi:hypothetical protein
MVTYWRNERDFPAPAIRANSRFGGNWYERAAVRAWLVAHPEYQTSIGRETI